MRIAVVGTGIGGKSSQARFAQPRNLLSPGYLSMLRDVLVFNRESVADCAAKELLRSFFALPAVPLKIIAPIHWEALRLWLKGVQLVPRSRHAVDERLASDTQGDYTSTVMSSQRRR